jgi:two-component system LytT family response regulator
MRLAVFMHACEQLPRALRSIELDPDFTLVRRCANRPQLIEVLDDFVPELVAVGDDEIDEITDVALTEQYSFLVIRLTRHQETENACPRIAATIHITDEIESVRAALYTAKSAAMSAKLQELARLASEYRKFGPFQRYSSSLEAVDKSGSVTQIPVAAIMSILADGKYAIVNSASGDFRMRESLENLQLRLDPRLFQRIHRGSIVNKLAVVQMTSTPDGPRIQLSNGTVLAVGPRYRHNAVSVTADELLA